MGGGGCGGGEARHAAVHGRESGMLQSMESQRVGHDGATELT